MVLPLTDEPSRTDLIRHFTFDYPRGQTVTDTSPQGTSGTVTEGELEYVTGLYGNAAQFSKDDELTLSGLSGTSFDSFTICFFIEVGQVDFTPADESRKILTEGGNSVIVLEENRNISFRVPDIDETDLSGGTIPTDDRIHVTVRWDGEEREIRLDNSEVAVENIGGGTSTFGETVLATVGAANNFVGIIEDFRFYRDALTNTEIQDIINVSTDRPVSSNISETWDNLGIPYRGNNEKLAQAYGQRTYDSFRTLDAILQSRHIKDAAGQQLDRLGQIGGIVRQTNESDAKYRARIIGVLAAGRSSGNYESIVQTVKRILDISEDTIDFIVDYDAKPATVEIFVLKSAVDDNELTAAEFKDILEDTVLAGHDIEVSLKGDNPFTLKSSGDIDDPDLGLTSSSTPRGGGLVETI